MSVSVQGSKTKVVYKEVSYTELRKLARVAVSTDIRQRAPRSGRLGLCVACQQAVQAHFDTAGGFIGCPAASENTTFVLMPVNASGAVMLRRAVTVSRRSRSAAPKQRTRRFNKGRWGLKQGVTQAQINQLGLSETYTTVVQPVIDQGRMLTVAEVKKATGLPHHIVSEALNSMEKEKGILTAEDASPSK